MYILYYIPYVYSMTLYYYIVRNENDGTMDDLFVYDVSEPAEGM